MDKIKSQQEEKGTDENYTPLVFIKPLQEFLGGFDLDPFSCKAANDTISARQYWTKEDNALVQDWSIYQKKWVNPPYSRQLIGAAIAKTMQYMHIGETLLLVNSSTSARWYHDCLRGCAAFLFPYRRIQFDSPHREGKRHRNEYDQTLFYFGDRATEFAGQLESLGDSAQPFKNSLRINLCP